MDYTKILSRAWKITWQHKVLWIFGILSGCGSGGGNGGNSFRTSGNGGLPGPGGQTLDRWLERPEAVAIIIGVVVVILLISIAIFVLGNIGRGGLIGGIDLADAKGSVTFGEAWAVGLKTFWRLILVSLVLAVPIIILVVVGVGGTVLTAGLGLLCLIPVICVAVLALIPLGAVASLAQFSVVLDGSGVVDGYRKGWEVLKNNLGQAIVLWLITVVIGFLVGLAIAAPFLAAVVPLMIGLMASSGGDLPQLNTPLLIGAGLGFLCYLPIFLALQGILQTWTTSAWQLAYRQWTSKPTVLATPVPQIEPAV